MANESITINNHQLGLRPMQQLDYPALIDGFKKLSKQTIYFRFFSALRELTPQLAKKLTTVNPEKEAAFVLENHALGGLCAIGRYTNENCSATEVEFAVIVRDDLVNMGLGSFMMQCLIKHARSRGFSEMYGYVLAENERMISFCKKLGFRVKVDAIVPWQKRVSLALGF